MQLILPKGDSDLRKYSYLFDAGTNTDFTTIPQLIEVLRNVRATPRTIDGNDVVLHEMMGIVDFDSVQRCYLTRIGYVGGLPDFSSIAQFVRTFVPTLLGTGQRTNNVDNIDPPIRSSQSGQIVFPNVTGVTQYQGITCLYPTKVGTQNIPVSSWAFTPMTSYIERGFGGVSGGSLVHRRAALSTASATVSQTIAAVSYTSSESGVGKGVNLTQVQGANDVGFVWAYNTADVYRAGSPTRSNATDPNVPFISGTLVKDANPIQLIRGLILVAVGDMLRVIKLDADDLSFPATAPGEVATGTMAPLPELVTQRTYTL